MMTTLSLNSSINSLNSNSTSYQSSSTLDKRKNDDLISKNLPESSFIKDRKYSDDYQISPTKFASGKFANVYHVTSIKNATNTIEKATNSTDTVSSSLPLCAKIVRKKKGGKDLTEDLKAECAILQLAKNEQKNKFIIKLIAAYEQPREYQLILEYAPGGELWYHLINQEKYDPETHTLHSYKKIMFDIALGLQWLHGHRIVHLDLKPSNIFLKKEVFADPEQQAVIADFGLSRKLPDKSEIKKRKSLEPITKSLMQTNNFSSKGNTISDYKMPTNVDVNQYGEVRLFAGTPDFCAPEVLRYNYIDISADIFSLGCCYYIILTGQSAFQADDEYEAKNLANQKTFFNIENLEENYDDYEIFDENENCERELEAEEKEIAKAKDPEITNEKNTSMINRGAKNLCQNLLKKQCKQRLTIDQVLEHCFFDGIR